MPFGQHSRLRTMQLVGNFAEAADAADDVGENDDFAEEDVDTAVYLTRGTGGTQALNVRSRRSRFL